MLTEPSRPEPSRAEPTRAGIVPICCTKLPLATFIDTRGLEHCWETHRTLFRPQFLAGALALHSVAITHLQLLYTIEALKFFWESHRTLLESPSTPNFWHECWRFSWSQLGKKKFKQHLFEPQFFGPTFFWTKIFSRTKNILTQHFFLTKIIFEPLFF